MADNIRIAVIPGASGAEWAACMSIYHEAFPEWEREPEEVIAARVNAGDYLLVAGSDTQRLIGFYILELNPSLGYVMFNFLAIDQGVRGKGYGTELCRDAMERFRRLAGYPWLLIEAEDRQAIFYGRLGFWKLMLDYQVPRFDGGQSMPMHLMVLPAARVPESIPAGELAGIIRHLFKHGYLLSDEDPRIAAQLARIDAPVPLSRWPQEENA